VVAFGHLWFCSSSLNDSHSVARYALQHLQQGGAIEPRERSGEINSGEISRAAVEAGDIVMNSPSSDPWKRKRDPDDPSGFAPKWSPDHGASGRRRGRMLDAEEPVDLDAGRSAQDASPDVGLTMDAAPRSLKPAVLPERWTMPRRRVPFGMLGGLVCLGAAAFVVGRQLAVLGGPIAQLNSIVASQSPAGAAIERTISVPPDRKVNVPPPQLVVEKTPPLSANEALRLGVSLEGPSDGAVLLIGGLAPGSTFSVGRSIGGNWWRLSAAELGNAILAPPRGFVGIADLTVELRFPGDTIADRKSMRLEWSAPKTVPELAFAGRRLDADEVASLLRRGEEFVAKGDLAAARSLFERAAEAGDARAAFALAQTYDPLVLQRWGEQGFAPDIAVARTWYERARELGSSEASQRLQMLASQEK
jgi:hypothetical protein